MIPNDFVGSIGLPFLAHRLRRLSDLIVQDMGAILREQELDIPPRAASLMLLLEEAGEMPIMVVAQRLRLSHPMVISLARSLAGAGLVEDLADPRDSRRRLLRLTDRGRTQAAFLARLNAALAGAFAAMAEESGVDLFAAVQGFERAADTRPVARRVRESLDQASGESGSKEQVA